MFAHFANIAHLTSTLSTNTPTTDSMPTSAPTTADMPTSAPTTASVPTSTSSPPSIYMQSSYYPLGISDELLCELYNIQVNG